MWNQHRCFSLPERVEDAAVVPDPQHAIGRGDPVGVGLLGVAEKGVGDPDLPHHVAVETQHFHGTVKLEPPVVPGLGEEDIDGVLLQGATQSSRGLPVKGSHRLQDLCNSRLAQGRTDINMQLQSIHATSTHSTHSII